MNESTAKHLEKIKNFGQKTKKFVKLAPEKTEKKGKGKKVEYFECNKDGLFLVTGWENEGKETAGERQRLGNTLKIVARTREAEGEGWGALLEWHDCDKQRHEIIVKNDSLGQPGSPWFYALLDGGYVADVRSIGFIKNYILSYPVLDRATIVSKTGWTQNCGAFVLPGGTVGKDDSEEKVILAGGNSAAYCQGGNMEGWKALAAQAAGNSRLVFALSAALAGPLLYIVGQESGGFNFVGDSSTGKSTALRLAASVWGGPEHVKSWRTTDNAAESAAVSHNDSLLILDELGQATAKTCSEMAYMLSNGAGKSRAGRDGQARAVQTWRVLFLSSGEIGIADKMAEAGQRPKAGQEVRLVDLPADAGRGIGIFDNVPTGFTPGAFAQHIKKAAGENFGHAGRAFVHAVLQGGQEAERGIREAMSQYAASFCPAGADGQVQRVAARFALCAAAGAFAVQAGILPLAVEDVEMAAKDCFTGWIKKRGGIGSGEDNAILSKFFEFFELHGQSRFQNLEPRTDAEGSEIEQTVINRAGFRDSKAFYVLPEAWKNQIFAGLNEKRAAKILFDAGYLKQEETPGRMLSKKYFPALGGQRCYVIKFEANNY